MSFYTDYSRHGRHRGATLIYATLLLIVMLGFASLAIDYGHVQLARTELQRTADSAARAAAAKLNTSPTAAKNEAIAYASKNLSDGAAITLKTADIEFGTWNEPNKTFVVLPAAQQSSANAVRVTARRDTANGNPVELSLAGMLGFQTVNVKAQAIALASPVGYGMIGLDYIKMGGNSSTAYWSTTGSSAGQKGNIASNGNISLSGSTSVDGNARPGPGRVVTGKEKVTGDVSPLADPLVFPELPAGDPNTFRTVNNNSNAKMNSSSYTPKGNEILPGGVYYFNNFNVGNNDSVTFTGPTTVYVYGTITLSGGATTQSNLPKNLKIVMVRTPSGALPGAINVGSHTALYADIYAPLSPINMSGTGDIYGSVLGKSIDMTGTSSIHYDLSLAGNDGTVSLVN